MFSGAVTCLIVAVGAAVLGFGGLADATAAAFAQHIFLIAIGLFAISAVAVIFDLEFPHVRLAQLIGAEKVDPKWPSYNDDIGHLPLNE